VGNCKKYLTPPPVDKAERWSQHLLEWFDGSQRAMPWRDDPSPYRTWISECMLQQTQVDTVIPYFNRFIKLFPTVHDLASADLQRLLKAWEGLGYYSRARNLHKAAKVLVDDHNGRLPETYDALKQLPGLGPYIAAAIASIAFGKAVPVVDGNVLRVFARFWGIEDDIRDNRTRLDLFERLTPVIKHVDPASFNQAMMELGALICKPKSPDCTHCPIQNSCFAYKHQRTSELPHKSKKAPTPHYDIAVGIIWKKDKLLIAKRKTTQMLGGLWEFPGGKKEDNESLEDAVLREILEETNLKVAVGRKYCTVKHAFTHFKITLHAYYCTVQSGEAQAVSSDALEWVYPSDLEEYPFPTANRKIIEVVRGDSVTA